RTSPRCWRCFGGSCGTFSGSRTSTSATAASSAPPRTFRCRSSSTPRTRRTPSARTTSLSTSAAPLRLARPSRLRRQSRQARRPRLC
ncbi:hypothetical protein LPJ57_009652, partial [Coemansia sp. RSA 486]